jgi:hypothetical protein
MRLLLRPLRDAPRILGGHHKNREIIKISQKSETYLIIIVIEFVISLINYPPLPL